MNVAELGAVAAALLALPVGFMTALWARRSGERSADATLSAGLSQADASLAAAHVQTRSEHELLQQTALTDTSSVFLRAADALARTVRHLPSVDHDERSAQLDAHGMAVETAFGPLELLAPPDLLRAAKALLEYCRTLERLALDRAVLRSALEALESGWGPFNAETSDHDCHGAAFVAWDLLMGWSSKDDEERWKDRDLLEFCLQESQCFSSDETSRVLALADRVPAAWPQMIGGLIRDPLMERFADLRTPFVESARPGQAHVTTAER
ncbi:hypothetical protein ACFV9D_27185 [Streptomyces sp. NPDC059875]|uniref:hypothetical protein n=1 Tax=unclassified Streptomyces TaxID=2593676 RepID=UPI00365F9D2E